MNLLAVVSNVKNNLEIAVIIAGFIATVWHIAEVKASIETKITSAVFDSKDAIRALKDDIYSTISQIDKRVDVNARDCSIGVEQATERIRQGTKRVEAKIRRLDRTASQICGYLAKHSTFEIKADDQHSVDSDI